MNFTNLSISFSFLLLSIIVSFSHYTHQKMNVNVQGSKYDTINNNNDEFESE
jgi:hypothetical protein